MSCPAATPFAFQRPLDDLSLHDLVALAAGEPLDPGRVVLRVTGNPPRAETFDLHGAHPLQFLLGLVAPAEWHAIGVRCTGRAYTLDDSWDSETAGYRITADEVRDVAPVTITFLLDRNAHGVGIISDASGERHVQAVPDGTLGDACRRALGLPTRPPPSTSTDLWSRWWLQRVIAAAVSCRGSWTLTWQVAAALHPCSGFGFKLGPAPGTKAIAEITQMLADDWPWQRLRQDRVIGKLSDPPLDTATAQWMDDGMFARWLLAGFEPLPALVKAAEQQLPPAVFAEITRALADIALAPAAPEARR